jgi:hypothetical protein
MKRVVVAVAVAALCLAACGGAPSGGVASAGAGGGAGPGGDAASCLASADAKHPRKPQEPFRITAKHVLVFYSGAKRAPETVTRTREQACLRAEEALSKLKAGASFDEVVATYSDEPGAKDKKGSIGSIQHDDVAPSFGDAAFELQVGEVSEVVETPFGFHVILRTE